MNCISLNEIKFPIQIQEFILNYGTETDPTGLLTFQWEEFSCFHAVSPDRFWGWHNTNSSTFYKQSCHAGTILLLISLMFLKFHPQTFYAKWNIVHCDAYIENVIQSPLHYMVVLLFRIFKPWKITVCDRHNLHRVIQLLYINMKTLISSSKLQL